MGNLKRGDGFLLRSLIYLLLLWDEVLAHDWRVLKLWLLFGSEWILLYLWLWSWLRLHLNLLELILLRLRLWFLDFRRRLWLNSSLGCLRLIFCDFRRRKRLLDVFDVSLWNFYVRYIFLTIFLILLVTRANLLTLRVLFMSFIDFLTIFALFTPLQSLFYQNSFLTIRTTS